MSPPEICESPSFNLEHFIAYLPSFVSEIDPDVTPGFCLGLLMNFIGNLTQYLKINF